jgi:peptidyl-prolyl cis-trans isomerase-like 3
MAKKGPGTNGSQFFITSKEAGHLEDKNTVIGRVISGAEYGDTLNKMEGVEVDKKSRPKGDKIGVESVQIYANSLAG